MISGVEMDSRKEFSVMISCAAARGENPEILARSGAAPSANAANKMLAAPHTTQRPRPLERRRRTSRRRQMSLFQIADGLFERANNHLNLRRGDNERRRDQNMIAARA